MRIFLMIVIIILVLTCVIFLVPTAMQLYRSFIVNQSYAKPAAITGYELYGRVDDSISYLNTTVAIVGAIVVLMGLAAGLSFWRIREYAPRVFKDEYLTFKESLDPILQSKKKELRNFSTQGVQVLASATDILLNQIFTAERDMYSSHLTRKGLEQSEIDRLIQEKKERQKELKRVTKFQICSLSQDESIAETNCQNLGSVRGCVGSHFRLARVAGA